MPSLRIIYDVVAGALHNRAVALQKYAPADFQVSLAPLRRPGQVSAALRGDPVDLVFLLSNDKTKAVGKALRQRGWRSKLVVDWSMDVHRTVADFFDLYDEADAWVINNQADWDVIGRLPRTCVIRNGVDPDVFNVTRPPKSRAPKVLWVGSEQHRRPQGYDDFLLPLRAKLRKRGIDCELHLVDSRETPKRTPAQMAEWYNSGTVLVCASDCEGTPDPALEAAACGCTVVSTRVGTMPELIRNDVNGYLVGRSVDALLNGVTAACENYVRLSRRMRADIRNWHWVARRTEFFRWFREVLDARPRRNRRRDLSKKVTVFVTTVGAPTFESCMERLRQQDCTYRLQVIDRVAPMSAAFQRMLDACKTPYYVQVDEDMLLYPHAVRTLYQRIVAAASNVAAVVADLYDVHLRRCILGVKIFRHDIVRRYPFAANDAFETGQMTRLTADGYTCEWDTFGIAPVAGQTLGLHGVRWTPQSIYERYLTLARRWRIYPADMAWFAEYPERFVQRYLDEPSPENFFTLLGVIAGVLAARDGEANAKDFRGYAALPGFELAQQFLAALAAPAAGSQREGVARRRRQPSIAARDRRPDRRSKRPHAQRRP